MNRKVVVSLREIADLNPRLQADIPANARVAFVPMSAISAEDARANVAETRPYSEVSKGYSPFLSGDLLVAKITPCFENGKIAQIRFDEPFGFGSTEFHVVRPQPDRVDARYLLHYLRQERVRRSGEGRMTGSAGQRRVPEHFLSTLPVPLPVLAEQRRIATVLDEVESLRAKRRATLALLDSLASAVFLEMFGDPLSVSTSWERRSLAQIGAVVTGNTPSRAREDYFGDAIEWIKSDNLNTTEAYATPASEGLSELGRGVGRVAPAGSILVTCIAGSPACIGNAAILNRDAAFNQQINALIPKTGDVRFLYSQLRVAKELVQQASTGGMKGLVSKSRFEGVTVLFPPLEQQRQFGEIFDQIECQKSRLRRSLRELDSLFASLQHEAFNGELVEPQRTTV